ncbi:uncharacterized protein LOC135491513 [Lineus longissimus]|uniref:uncharacterized protein LOC135491513 n=1 Tax=Lineus longissimus TaxID=88925 RepID=UPI002B4E4180
MSHMTVLALLCMWALVAVGGNALECSLVGSCNATKCESDRCSPVGSFEAVTCNAVKCACNRSKFLQNLSPSCKAKVLAAFFDIDCEKTKYKRSEIVKEIQKARDDKETHGCNIDCMVDGNCPVNTPVGLAGVGPVA